MLTNHPPNSPIIQPQSFLTSFSHIPPVFNFSSPYQRTDRRFSHARLDRTSRFSRDGFPSLLAFQRALNCPIWPSSCGDMEVFVFGEVERYKAYPGRSRAPLLSLFWPFTTPSGHSHRSIHPLDQTIPWVSTAYPLLIPPSHFCPSHQSPFYRIPINPILFLKLSARAIHPSHQLPDPRRRPLTIRIFHPPIYFPLLLTISFISCPFLHQT
ncbi:hypothetical protein BD769DRAFT_1673703 [Suillus cothurnatus]|nr:hypothetical protein BD769DRAFT_1673703 [Suillus cothurnatus]